MVYARQSRYRLAALLVAGAAVAASGETLRVMSFNLRYASGADGSNAWFQAGQSPARRTVARDMLLQRQPHLVGLQEGEPAQLDDLMTLLPSYYRMEREGPSGGGGSEQAAFLYDTNALALVDRGVFSLGPSPGGGYWNHVPGSPFAPWTLFPENFFAFPRLALWGEFRWRVTGQTFFFYTTHFDVYNNANGGQSQVNSAALITDDAKARCRVRPASPLAVVVGDFNSNQNDRPWKLCTGTSTNGGITGDFIDSWWQVHGSWNNAGTFHGFAGGVQPADRRIDWILHRGGFTATQAVIATGSVLSTNLATGQTHVLYPSDHYPVVAALRFPPVAPDADRDGLPDALEFASPRSHPTLADSDGDLLLDGEEDLDGDGMVGGGETDPASGGDTQRPTDIRYYQMDGVADFRSTVVAQNGLILRAAFDGRYLYVATQDAGEGNDHVIFIATNPASAVNAPWAKGGTVGRYAAFLADENDNGFAGWFNAANQMITNLFLARAATYYQNGGWLEGVLDAGVLFGAGFTGPLFIAAAPYGNSDGGALITSAQVPAGNGDTHLLGNAEYVNVTPGDRDGDGISDAADPDQDGDGLPDAWEVAHGLDPRRADGLHGAAGDLDGDGVSNRDEWFGRTAPGDAGERLVVTGLSITGNTATLTWNAVFGAPYRIGWATTLQPQGPWLEYAPVANGTFPSGIITQQVVIPLPLTGTLRVGIAP